MTKPSRVRRLDTATAHVPVGGGFQYERLQTPPWVAKSTEPNPTRSKPDEEDEALGGLSRMSPNLGDLLEVRRLHAAKVERNDAALRLLAELYRQRVLTSKDFEPAKWRLGVAVGLLAAAQFCDIDDDALRLRDEGAWFVRNLIAEA